MSKEENQKRAPICAAFVKAMREAFGQDQVKVTWLQENGLTLGVKEEE